ncbi:actin-like protein 4 [Blastomyces dermatitidis ATCC 26199]|nr:actin-like protein 4 [Blastomyces dermatitidis ATCC 26199]
MSSLAPPATAEYGGDEVSAIILDPGYSTVRAGFAGEDTPKSVIPTCYGKYSTDAQDKYIYGDSIYVTPRPGLAIRNPMGKEGIVEDWDMAEKVWEYSFTSRLTGTKSGNPLYNGLNDTANADLPAEMDVVEAEEKPLTDSPLLMTECGWNPVKAREKTIEIAMEKWGSPAFYLARNGPLAAFAAGKASALVVDVGASGVSITPVHDGLVLKRGVQHSPLGGEFINSQIRALFKTNTPQPITITPHYLVSSKTAIDAGQPAQATYKTIPADRAPDPSFRRLLEDRTISEFKECVVQVWPGPHSLSSTGPNGVSNEEIARGNPGRPFEFPDGYNQVFGAERYRVVESLFDAQAAIPDPESEFPAPTAAQTIPELIRNSLNQVDVDIRPHLLANVVVTGATSLLYGFNDRLNFELMNMFPSPRVRITAPGNTAERKFGSWIGGSIVASLGTFHQMWISKKEFDEHGPNISSIRYTCHSNFLRSTTPVGFAAMSTASRKRDANHFGDSAGTGAGADSKKPKPNGSITSFFGAPKVKNSSALGTTKLSFAPVPTVNFNKEKWVAGLTAEQKELLKLEIDTLDESWLAHLKEEVVTTEFLNLKRFLKREIAGGAKIFPPLEEVYSWSRYTPLHTVRAVILGQDPYHNHNQAHGLCFSVRPPMPAPPSLKNIYIALKNDYPSFTKPPNNGGHLVPWANRGVLMLNTCLTVRAHNANSHANQGWERFTQKVIDVVAKTRTRGVVFLAWGKPAGKRVAHILRDKEKRHCVLQSVHPSPLSAHGGFLKCGHFKKTNEWLLERYGKDGVIDWSLVEEKPSSPPASKPTTTTTSAAIETTVEINSTAVSTTGKTQKVVTKATEASGNGTHSSSLLSEDEEEDADALAALAEAEYDLPN